MEPEEQQPEQPESLSAQVLPTPEPNPRGTLEHINLVEQLADAKLEDDEEVNWLKWYGKRTCKEWADDFESNKPTYERMARDLELFLGQGDNFDYGPAEGKPRPCLPILNKVVVRIFNRAAVTITKLDPVAVPTGSEDNERAERISKHLAWEKRAKHPGWKSGMAASLLQWVIYGSAFRYIGWDPIQRKKKIAHLYATDCVVGNDQPQDDTPCMENISHYTISWRMKKNELQELARPQGTEAPFFVGVEELFAEGGETRATPISRKDASDDPIRRAINEFEGRQDMKSYSAKDEKHGNPTYLVLERHSWERLPGMDKMYRVAAWVEESTKKVLRIVIMEQQSALDRRRYENETQAREMMLENIALEAEEAMAWNAQAEMENGAMMAMPADPMMPPQEPIPLKPVPQIPQNLPEIRPIRMEPVFPVVHYKFMENPEGFYGLGAGVFASQLNLLANEAISWDLIGTQLAAVAVSSGFLSREFVGEKGPIELDFGKFKQLKEVDAEQLAKGMRNFPFAAPPAKLGDLVQVFDEQAQLQMNAHDVLSGIPGPSHESATAAQNRNQRAAENITMAIEAAFIPLAAEFKAYARLNATFMDNEEYFYVQEADPTNPSRMVSKRVTVGRSDYEEDYDITFDSDQRLAVDPGLGEKAMTAYQLVIASPFADANTKLEAEKKALRALGQEDLVKRYPDFIPPEPPPSPKSQQEENAGFIEEQDSQVLPDDDDLDHLGRMEEFEGMGMYQQMTPTGKQLFDRHKRAHQAKAYLRGSALQMQNAQSPTAFEVASERTGTDF